MKFFNMGIIAMKFIHYIKEKNIYLIDYSGKITLEEGHLRMKMLAGYFENLSLSQKCIKVVYDVRNADWVNIETHNELSRIFRNQFSGQSFYKKIHLAILNNHYNNSASEYEHWFLKEEDAINWLDTL